jgi:hypothetical protein
MDTTPTVYIVKNSGVRCLTTPCPYYNAFRADAPDEEPIRVHELDLAGVTGGDGAKKDALMHQLALPEGLKVEATLGQREHAGPAGTATVLRPSKVLGG